MQKDVTQKNSKILAGFFIQQLYSGVRASVKTCLHVCQAKLQYLLNWKLSNFITGQKNLGNYYLNLSITLSTNKLAYFHLVD